MNTTKSATQMAGSIGQVLKLLFDPVSQFTNPFLRRCNALQFVSFTRRPRQPRR
jgi:hypothetical protein